MSTYKIYKAQFNNAKKLGVTIKPSENKHKKVDVFDKDNKRIASIGSIRYGDYHNFIDTKGKEFAEKRKAAYLARHAKTLRIVGSPSYYAAKILWS